MRTDTQLELLRIATVQTARGNTTLALAAIAAAAVAIRDGTSDPLTLGAMRAPVELVPRRG